MNTTIRITIAALALSASTVSSAGLFDSVMTSDWGTVGSTHYKLDAYGFDARVYEWTPLENPNVRCVFVAANKSSGVSCYEVPAE